MITGAQMRAARALLDWQRKDLCEAAKVKHSTLADFEKGRTESMLSQTMGRIIEAFEKEGVVFIGRLGVAFKEERPKLTAPTVEASE
jgi:transcriptional regulator with XRE-family HTH domain